LVLGRCLGPSTYIGPAMTAKILKQNGQYVHHTTPGKLTVIVRALYGLKSAGASFRNHLADYMRELGYDSCKADPDVWMKPEIRANDGFKYYSYVLCYVDDVLCIHHNAREQIRSIDRRFPLKKSSVGDLDIYLGAKLRKVELENGVNAWSLSPSKYVQEAVKNVKAREVSGTALAEEGHFPFRQGLPA
jgi:hypothetical protein